MADRRVQPGYLLAPNGPLVAPARSVMRREYARKRGERPQQEAAPALGRGWGNPLKRRSERPSSHAYA